MGERTKKGKNGIVKLVFSRMFIFGLIVLTEIMAALILVFSANEEAKEIYKYINIFALFLVVYIINERDTDPTMKMIWSVSVLAIPVFGCLMYLYVKFQYGARVMKDRIENINEVTKGYLKPDSDIYAGLQIEDYDTFGLSNYVYNYSGYPVYKNSKVTYFPSGETKFKALIEQLNKAEKFIFIEYFIIEEGYMWDTILQILERKQKEGVEIRVMYDGMCSLIQLPVRYFKKLRKKGIQAKAFAPMRPFVSTHQNNRDHRKIVVIDGAVAFTGGVNLADEYINYKKRFGYWKDAAVMFEGDVARSYTLMFLRMWNISNKKIENFHKYINVEIPRIEGVQGYVLGYADDPFDNENIGEYIYLHMLNTAKKYVHIVTPYLVLDNIMMNALKFAAKRGVEVKIVMPGIPDKAYAFCVARTYYKELIEAGVKIYEFTPGFTHAKMFIVDDKKATVGTVNLDYRSLYLHFECGAYITDNDEILKMEADYSNMLKSSRSISMMECHNRPILYKFAGKVLRIIAPLM